MGQWLSVPFILMGAGLVIYSFIKKQPVLAVHPEKKKQAPTHYAKSIGK